MNASDYTFLLARPSAVREKHLTQLDTIVREFPYLQSARALQLKGLYNQDSFRYNSALKVAAAHTYDRGVLFDFITSGNFSSLQEAFHLEREAIIREISVYDSEIVTLKKPDENVNPLEASIRTSINTVRGNREEKIEEKLEIGKPLDFSGEEKHSFSEWLQLTGFHPIAREEEKPGEIDPEKKKKLDIIDKFIEANPKIISSKDEPVPLPKPVVQTDNSALMTETLARVYLEQRKYQKAIQAYQILILKYPEKSSLFADRISDIKLLQQNNN